MQAQFHIRFDLDLGFRLNWGVYVTGAEVGLEVGDWTVLTHCLYTPFVDVCGDKMSSHTHTKQQRIPPVFCYACSQYGFTTWSYYIRIRST